MSVDMHGMCKWLLEQELPVSVLAEVRPCGNHVFAEKKHKWWMILSSIRRLAWDLLDISHW